MQDEFYSFSLLRQRLSCPTVPLQTRPFDLKLDYRLLVVKFDKV